MLGNWAAGPGAAGQGFFRAAEVAGGGAHKFVYGAGKFFDKNFKPWEAVKYAKWIGNLGKALGGWPGALLAQRRLRHKCSKPSYQIIFWIIVTLFQVAAADVILGHRLSRALLAFMNQ